MMKPVIMGSLMGLMMMWMLHGALTGGTMAAGALLAFVAAHVLIAGVLAGVVWLGVRLSPRMQKFAARLHRPSLHHIGAMFGSAAVVAGAVHLVAHGGLV